jgi:DeoR/GlpR family transcriptional regulator of sugar metabolism
MLKTEERRKKLLDFIKEKQKVQISDLSDLINNF